MLARDKRSSLLWKVVTYGRKKFYNIGHMTCIFNHQVDRAQSYLTLYVPIYPKNVIGTRINEKRKHAMVLAGRSNLTWLFALL